IDELSVAWLRRPSRRSLSSTRGPSTARTSIPRATCDPLCARSLLRRAPQDAREPADPLAALEREEDLRLLDQHPPLGWADAPRAPRRAPPRRAAEARRGADGSARRPRRRRQEGRPRRRAAVRERAQVARGALRLHRARQPVRREGRAAHRSEGTPREVDARYLPDLDDGVMINSAALWPLLEPQWKDPKKCWKELSTAQGKKDWSHLAVRYWPTRVDAKCVEDPSLGVAHGCFWRYHPAPAWGCASRTRSARGRRRASRRAQ